MAGKLPKQPFRYLPLRIITSVRSIFRFFYRRPSYIILAILYSFVFFQFIYWALNLGLAGYLLLSPYMSIFDRFDLAFSSYTSLLSAPHSTLGTLLILASVFQGMSLALLTFAIRRERKQARSMASAMSGVGATSVLSVLGLGCSACGSSLVTPLLTFFFATSSVSVAEQVGELAALFALVASIVTLYLLGLKYSIRA